MVTGIPAWLYAQAGQDIEIQPYEGSGAAGDIHGAAATVRGIVEDRRRKVLNSLGEEVISETTVRCPLETVAPAGSLVTVNIGTGWQRTARVLNVLRHDGRVLPVPSHLEVVLT